MVKPVPIRLPVYVSFHQVNVTRYISDYFPSEGLCKYLQSLNRQIPQIPVVMGREDGEAFI